MAVNFAKPPDLLRKELHGGLGGPALFNDVVGNREELSEVVRKGTPRHPRRAPRPDSPSRGAP